MKNLAKCSFMIALVLFSSACEKKADPGKISVSGWVEPDTIKIAPLIGGKVLEVHLEEGSVVKKDEVVLTFDCKELELQLKQAEAAVKGANAQLKLIKKGARDEDIANMREVVHQAEIAKENADKDLERTKKLFEDHAVPEKQYDDTKTRADVASAQLEAVKQQYAKVQNGSRAEEKEAAQAGVEQAEAMVDLLKEKLTKCTVSAPANGTVLHKLIEPGEVAGTGVSIAIIADLTHVKVKGYVEEEELGFLTLGKHANVFIDSEPETPISAKITFVSSEAEFTPKNIQTRTERAKTMYQFEATAENSNGKLKSGMPADIVIEK